MQYSGLHMYEIQYLIINKQKNNHAAIKIQFNVQRVCNHCETLTGHRKNKTEKENQ